MSTEPEPDSSNEETLIDELVAPKVFVASHETEADEFVAIPSKPAVQEPKPKPTEPKSTLGGGTNEYSVLSDESDGWQPSADEPKPDDDDDDDDDDDSENDGSSEDEPMRGRFSRGSSGYTPGPYHLVQSCT